MKHGIWSVAVLVCVLFLAAPVVAQAACIVSVDGLNYVDSDCDGVPDETDNCPDAKNGDCSAKPSNCDVDDDGTVTTEERDAGGQADWNGDGDGDACTHSDDDNIIDYLDNCPGDDNADQDRAACNDADEDGLNDDDDNCPADYNSTQANQDGDSFGDACDICPLATNEDQNPNACPVAERGAIPEAQQDESTAPQHEPNIPGGAWGDHVEGSGGCSLSANAAATPWALLMMVAAGAIAAVRRRR